MRKKLRHIIIREVVWLIVILAASAAIEFLIIQLFDLHPVLSVKAQGFIGLLIIGYAIRMFARIKLATDEDAKSHPTNGQKILE